MAERQRPATRIALLEAGEERRTAREGYDLLDEKRMLLAARMLRLIDTVVAGRRVRHERWLCAREALRAALERHGLQGLETLPPVAARFATAISTERVVGVELVTAVAHAESAIADEVARRGHSPESLACASAWRELACACIELAAHETSLWRLADEYARTERRASAIEHVLLPELEHEYGTIESDLEAIEREETARAHRA